MQRPAHGGSTRPSYTRPGNGFGRMGGRPGPFFAVEAAASPEPVWFDDETYVPIAPPIRTPGLAWREVLDREAPDHRPTW